MLGSSTLLASAREFISTNEVCIIGLGRSLVELYITMQTPHELVLRPWRSPRLAPSPTLTLSTPV